jgi:nitrite reductase/ring-hydroxylating ferredoxin subunit
MSRREICATDDLDPGERLIVDTGGRELAVFNVDGEFVAVANYCVHAGGPVCEGTLSGMVTASPDEWEYGWDREGEILACPWHGWEFDLLSGEHLSDPNYRLLTYDVTVSDGIVYVETGPSGTSAGDPSATTEE